MWGTFRRGLWAATGALTALSVGISGAGAVPVGVVTVTPVACVGTNAGAGDAIQARHLALGGDSGWLGPVTGDCVSTGATGAHQQFTHGTIYAPDNTNAYAVSTAWTAIYTTAGGPTTFGWPLNESYLITSRVSPTYTAARQDFTKGRIYSSVKAGVGTRVLRTTTPVGAFWIARGAENSTLGLPTSTESSGGRSSTKQTYERGAIYSSTSTGTHSVETSIATYYASLGSENSALGLPTAQPVTLTTGTRQDFQNGRIFWNSTTGTTTHIIKRVITSWKVQRPSITNVDWWRVQGTTNSPHTVVTLSLYYGGAWHNARSTTTTATGSFDFAVPTFQGTNGTWPAHVYMTDQGYQQTRISSTTTLTRTTPAGPYSYGRTSTGTPTNPQPLPYASAKILPIPTWQWTKITATQTWRSGCPGSQSSFRRVEVPYYGYDGLTHRGWITVRSDVATSTANFFNAMYAQRFPMRRVESVEMFGGWDLQSEKADNTSSMNCRKPSEANSPQWDSPHANGRALDINPYRNPWKQFRTGAWEPSSEWTGAKRTLANEKYGVIVSGGKVYNWLTSHGWIWRGTARELDYQHFDTGYPSRYRSGF